MENKTTMELMELLREGGELVDKDGNILDEEKYDGVFEELKKREPFFSILNEEWEEGLPMAWEVIKELREEIKLLKRHKHEPNTGDVMVRI